MRERETHLFGDKGYRDDELFGDHVRDPLDGERRERIVAELERRGALVVVAMPNPRDILEALLARA